MTLKLRPTGLSSGIDKDRRTTSSALAAGILAASTRPVAAPENMRWFWSLTINGPMTRADRERGRRMINATGLGDDGPVRDT
jgi:hypothetical protein